MDIVAALATECKNLRSALHSFERTLQRVTLTKAAGKSVGHASTRRRRLSRKTRASLVLQGRYMGYMRQLKPRQKAQVQKVKEAKGVRAAIAKAKSLAA